MRALAYAHREGVVHRDVKPGNILLRPVSPGAARSVQLESLEHPVVPLLSDFGIARVLDAPELTSAGRTVGTPAYMAPEQCAGSREVDGRADVYALGAVLYRCVSGRLPFTGTTTQILHAQVYDPLTIDDAVLRILPPIFVEMLQRSMAKNPEDRYATADQMADDLALAAGRTPPRPDASAAEATATLTLASLPATTGQNPPSTTTVLVSGTGAQSRVPASGQPARPQEAPHQMATGGSGGQPPGGGVPPLATELEPEPEGFGGRLERMNWAGVAIGAMLLLTLIGGIVLFGATGAGLLDRLAGQPTPTPGQVSLASATPTYTSTATPTPPPTDTPLPATATVLPTATETLPPPPPTDAPPPRRHRRQPTRRPRSRPRRQRIHRCRRQR
ncbi:MAG: serine/threonine protein kinase [Anaerolineales bacterium]|nr:serine/threonine protein kinase [Anaerolineales bacterium]